LACSKRARKAKATGDRYGGAVAEFLKTLGNRAAKPFTSLTPQLHLRAGQ
jgi:hypothetical protein